MNDLRAQLAPGWSGVNVALTVVLFLMAWPLGLVMVGYIVWGRQLGLDLSRPETLAAFGGRIKHAWQAGSASWGGGGTRPLSTGTPEPGTTVPHGSAGGSASARTDAREERTALREEREALERERHAFEMEKSAWHERRPAGERETLDS